MTSNSQNQNPDTLENALQIVDRILLEVLQDPGLKPADKIRAISLFYKRHQIGGFAPRSRKTTATEAVQKPASRSSVPHLSLHTHSGQKASPPLEAKQPVSKPSPPLPQHHPAAQGNAYRDTARLSQPKQGQRRR